MTRARGRRSKGPKGSAKQKGDIVEEVVAMMHQEPEVEVRRDVRLPAKNSGSRSRQIDVVVLGRFAGYPTMLAIECKNFRRPINVRDIGTFRDLLEDVGLAPQQGILVSTSSIGEGALGRAQELGIKVLELSGLTPDRLSAALHDATQLVVFVVPAMEQLSVVNEIPGPAETDELMTLFDVEGNMVASIPDLLWLRWLEGEPPSFLGEHELDLQVPEGWHTRVNGRREPVLSVSAKVKVRASVVVFPGTASNFTLVDPNDLGLKKLRSTASFEHALGEYPVYNFEEEFELEKFVEGQKAAIKITVGRIRTPRIWVNQDAPVPKVLRGRSYRETEARRRRGRRRP
jgi:hypothetical protein